MDPFAVPAHDFTLPCAMLGAVVAEDSVQELHTFILYLVLEEGRTLDTKQ